MSRSRMTDLANAALRAASPGNLLCGFEVRELVDGEWVRANEEES
jgi:hypothetical protein